MRMISFPQKKDRTRLEFAIEKYYVLLKCDMSLGIRKLREFLSLKISHFSFYCVEAEWSEVYHKWMNEWINFNG